MLVSQAKKIFYLNLLILSLILVLILSLMLRQVLSLIFHSVYLILQEDVIVF